MRFAGQWYDRDTSFQFCEASALVIRFCASMACMVCGMDRLPLILWRIPSASFRKPDIMALPAFTRQASSPMLASSTQCNLFSIAQ